MRFWVSRLSDVHKLDPPCPAAEETPTGWEIEVDDLAGLVALAEREGELLVSSAFGDLPGIAIADETTP